MTGADMDEQNTKRKAYSFIEPCNNAGAIYFANSNIEARKIGANEFNDGELGGVTCSRAPWADKYVGEGIPIWKMMAEGWNFECCGCGITMDIDTLEDEGIDFTKSIGTQHSMCFCQQSCKQKYQQERQEIEALQDYYIHLFKDMIASKFGHVEFSENAFQRHAYVTKHLGVFNLQQCRVTFKLPGITYEASLEYWFKYQEMGPIKPFYMCAKCDREAFEAIAKGKPAT